MFFAASQIGGFIYFLKITFSFVLHAVGSKVFILDLVNTQNSIRNEQIEASNIRAEERKTASRCLVLRIDGGGAPAESNHRASFGESKAPAGSDAFLPIFSSWEVVSHSCRRLWQMISSSAARAPPSRYGAQQERAKRDLEVGSITTAISELQSAVKELRRSNRNILRCTITLNTYSHRSE